MKPTQNQLDRLPKWAREYITDLERNERRAVAQLARYVGSENSKEGFSGKIKLRSYASVLESGVNMHDEARITFALKKDWQSQLTIGIDRDREDAIEVMGDGPIEILPRSSNVVLIRLKE